tara:strand:- start:120 stop:614 length:495 start_codon:yes stop_codon:yes gene_type:complete
MSDKKIVGFTCGAFDLLHAGHAMMLAEAKQSCDYLIVGVQGDPSIDRPGKNSPIQTYDERQIMVKSIRYVDEIALYNTEAELYELLKKVNPDVRIVGADWKGKTFTGYDLPIRVLFNSRDHGFSTSELRERVFNAEMQKVVTQHLTSHIPEDAVQKVRDFISKS